MKTRNWRGPNYFGSWPGLKYSARTTHPPSDIQYGIILTNERYELSQVRPKLTVLKSRDNILFPSVALSTFPPRVLATLASRRSGIGQPDVTIDMLHDDVLLEIFDFYRKLASWNDGMWNWQELLHVCRRWRYIILASSRRLDLQIECDRSTPTWDLLDVWPPFPISLSCYPWRGEGTRGNHNIFAALKRRNRISQIDFSDITCMEVGYFATAMDEPFPVLTDLRLGTLKMDRNRKPAVTAELPNSFLGGSAPRLQLFVLQGIAFPALTSFVLSASHFRHLHLLDIPHAGYIPPEAMLTFLLPLHSLRGLTIGFSSPKSRPLQMSLPPLTHALLPSLTDFQFIGVDEYLVDFIARIDTPMLDSFRMTFFTDVIPHHSQIHKFIDRTDRLKAFIQAEVCLCSWEVQAIFKSPANPGLDIICDTSYCPVLSIVRLFEQFWPIPSGVEQLELCEEAWDVRDLLVDQEDLWLQLLIPFVSVKSLYVSKGLVPFVASVLENLTGESVTGVLPILDNLFLEGFGSSGLGEETIRSFVSMRQLSGHPVIVRRWERKSVPGSSSGGSPFR